MGAARVMSDTLDNRRIGRRCQRKATMTTDNGRAFNEWLRAELKAKKMSQRQLAQRDQIALAKEILRSALGLLRHIDLAGFQARQQLVGGHVHQNQLIGCVEHGVGHGLVDAYAGDGTHRAIQAFQVLHIDGR